MSLQELEKLKITSKITACFVDLDNTLWEGIIAEGEKPKLIANRYSVLKKLHQKGIQLYIVSKNDPYDVEQAFNDLDIENELFTWVVVGWDPKFVNIQKLIDAAEIRPETAIFIDDNVFELNEVWNKIPAIHIVDAKHFKILLSIPAIVSKKEQLDSEIQERKNRYRTAIQSKFSKEKFSGADIEFYRSLKREISIGLVPADNLDRATRLLVETHRLNLNPGKFAEYEKALDYLHARFNAGDLVYAVATFEGEYSLGLTGVLVVNISRDKATITDGSFSCGIIGRDFEQKSILALIEKLKVKKIKRLEINLIMTATNVRVRKILEELYFSEISKNTDNRGNVHLKLGLDIATYKTDGYNWITISKRPPTFDYVGHPYVINFFEKYVKPLIFKSCNFINLGSARGEVLGMLQQSARKKFYDFLKDKKVNYIKIDMEYYSEEKNDIANAENLKGVVNDESQDIVMAVELLEHTQHPELVISEMNRICKAGGYIFISTPSFNFPKHEYPIDLWRFGPKTFSEIFRKPTFEIIRLEVEGDQKLPRRTMLLALKSKAGAFDVHLPIGKIDIDRNLTVFD